MLPLDALRRRRLRFAGGQRGSRVSQGSLKPNHGWVRAPQNAPSGLFRIRERRHGIAEIVEHGAFVFVSFATSLSKLNHHAACQTLALEVMPICQKSFGPAHRYTLELRATYARSLICGIGLLYEEGEERAAFYKILSQLHRAEQILETDLGLASRAFGATHKRTEDTKARLEVVRESITDWTKLFSWPRK